MGGRSAAGGAQRQVALLRGINVGKAKRVAMAELRALVESLGYGDVRTLLNSGNVVYSAPRGVRAADAAARIEEGLVVRLGVTSRVLALTAGELATAVAENALAGVATDDSRLLVTVLADPAADRPRLAPLTQQDWGDERLALGTRAAYLWCPPGLLASRLSDAVGRLLGERATTRNWATMKKLHALAGQAHR